MHCPDEEALVRWLGPERTGGAAIEVHVDSCTSCRAVVAVLARTSLVSRAQCGPVAAWPSDYLPAGVLVGRYRIEERIGAGAMGVVYRAADPELRRDVAIKQLRAAVADDPERQTRLLREARSLATLSHPNVVSVYDVGIHDGHAFLAMELVRGTTLRAWLDAGPRTRAEVIDAMRQIAAGLAAVHAAGLVHRDFKPDNVLVTHQGRVLVGDFGLVGLDVAQVDTSAELGSPDASGLTRTGALVGTPRYMAPEQIAGETAGPAADQFAFCLVLCEALTGERPFVGDSRDALLDAIHSGPRASVLARVPADLRGIVRRGLAADPAARHPDMLALAGLLAARPRRRLALGLALAGGVAIATAVFVSSSRSSEVRTSHVAAASMAFDDAGAAAALVEGEARVAAGDLPGAIRMLELAHERATSADAWAIATDAAIALTRVAGGHTEDLPAGLRWHRHGAADLERLGDDPDRRARLDDALGSVHYSAGRYPEARTEYAQGLALCSVRYGDDDPRTAIARSHLATVEAALGSVDSAIEHHRAALTRLDAVEYRRDRIQALISLANAQTAKRDDAGARVTLVEAQALLQPGDGERGRVANNLAIAMIGLDEYDAAALELDRAEADLTSTYGPDHPSLSYVVNARATLHAIKGDYPAAKVLFERALDMKEQLFGPDHPSLLPLVENLANLARIRGDRDAVVALQQRGLRLAEARYGADSLELAHSLEFLANTLATSDDPDGAMKLCERALAIRRTHVAESDPSLAMNWLVQAKAHLAREAWKPADAALAQALAIADEPPVRSSILITEAESYWRRDRHADARARAHEARAVLGDGPDRTGMRAVVDGWFAAH